MTLQDALAASPWRKATRTTRAGSVVLALGTDPLANFFVQQQRRSPERLRSAEAKNYAEKCFDWEPVR